MRRKVHRISVRLAAVAAATMLIAGLAAQAHASARRSVSFASPLFGMDARGGSLYVADAGRGVVKVTGGDRQLIASLPGVADVAVYGHDRLYAVTGDPDARLYRIVNGHVSQIANLGAFEARVNPDRGEIDSNPFGVAALPGGRALVSDAAANDLLMVHANGRIHWVATLPNQLVSTGNAKRIVGCPKPADPQNEEICHLPAQIPAQAVATSIAVGPDGSWYVSELKGFPAPLHRSRVWRIRAGTVHARCGSSPRCHVALRGLTSIVDLDFAPSGVLRVVELDEASWFAVESGVPTVGSIDSCNVWTGHCGVLAHLPMPSAVASTGGHVYATRLSLVPGQAGVVRIR